MKKKESKDESAKRSVTYLLDRTGWSRGELSQRLGVSAYSINNSMSSRGFSKQTRRGLALLIQLYVPGDDEAERHIQLLREG